MQILGHTYGASDEVEGKLKLVGNEIVFGDQIYGTASLAKTYTIIAWC